MAKGPSPCSRQPRARGRRYACEYGRSVARRRQGGVAPGTCNADEAAPMGGGRARPPLRVTRFNLVHGSRVPGGRMGSCAQQQGRAHRRSRRGRPPRRAGAAHARRPVRSAPKGEVRAVHARAGAPQADPQGGRQGPQPGDPHHGGPDRSGVAETGAGADLRSRLPPVLVRVPAQKTGAGRDRRDTQVHLAARGLRVGFRGGHRGVLRRDRSHRPDGAGARARRGQADPGADTRLPESRRPQ